MAITEIIPIEGEWTPIAMGEGYVVFNPLSNGLHWAINSTEPDLNRGHLARVYEQTSLKLEDGETLYVKGRGDVAVTADNPA
ncbi:MAG: hypothetical protein WCY93_07290 [Anaerolineaceae bacterium]